MCFYAIPHKKSYMRIPFQRICKVTWEMVHQDFSQVQLFDRRVRKNELRFDVSVIVQSAVTFERNCDI